MAKEAFMDRSQVLTINFTKSFGKHLKSSEYNSAIFEMEILLTFLYFLAREQMKIWLHQLDCLFI